MTWPHVLLPGTGTPWLLLHGTGADEHDLVPVARELVPTAPIISPRGRVLENGMARWFERYPQGGFNLADYHHRAAELLAWIEEKQQDLPGPWAILGYSNGANIATQLLRLRPDLFAGAVLWRAMLIDPSATAAQPIARPVLLTSGELDPILPIEGAIELEASLRRDGAEVEFARFDAGHGLTPGDLMVTQGWIARNLGSE